MTKLELIKKMVSESSRFENLTVRGLQVVGPEMPDYVNKISEFIYRRTKGISFLSHGLRTEAQVYNNYVDKGEWIFNRAIKASEFIYKGDKYAGSGDVISMRIVRKED